MLYNKNNVRKTNDKKILHKVGKQWKVVSVALLLAIGGGAAVTATHANAQSNDTNNDYVNSEVTELNTPSAANAPRAVAKSTASSASVAPKSTVQSAIHYYNGNNGSAASYFDKVDADNDTAAKYYNTVNDYVQSLNNEYNPQVNSYSTKLASAKSAGSNDSKLAKSYSATAKKGTTVNTINSLAAANHMDPTLYQGVVQDNETMFSTAVSSASDDVKANNDIASVVNRLENTNFTSASMSASASSVVAQSNYDGANYTLNSVKNIYGDLSGANLASTVNALSYGATELYATGNNLVYKTNANAIASLAKASNVNVATYTSNYNSDVNAVYSNAVSAYKSAAKSAASLNSYASNNSNFVAKRMGNLTNQNNSYDVAVSAAADLRFAPILASAANSLYAQNGLQYATYTTRSNEAKSVVASASAAELAASYASDFANANSTVVSNLSSAVSANGNNVASAISSLLTRNYNNNDNNLVNAESALSMNNDFANAALLSSGVDLNTLNSDFSSNVMSTISSAVGANHTTDNLTEKLGNALSVASNSAESAENSAVSASDAYSSANDEDVTLAGYFASSYANDANSESNSASAAFNGLNNFFKSMTNNDSTFTNADDAYNAAENAATNDYKLGVGYAQSVYNSNAHFLDVLKGARLHSTPNYGAKNDKVVGMANKGDRLSVLGVNVSRNHDWRGVVRYYVLDNTTGKKGFFTGQAEYSKAAYLSATTDHFNVEVKTLQPVNVYAGINDKKAIATVPAGKVLQNADVVYDNADEDAYGFTKVQTANGDFVTANTDYVEILTPTVNTNNTPQSNVSGFNLPNGQKMADYYNNFSQN